MVGALASRRRALYLLVSWQAARSRTSMIWSTHCIFWECESVSGSLSLAWYCKIAFRDAGAFRCASACLPRFNAIALKRGTVYALTG